MGLLKLSASICLFSNGPEDAPKSGRSFFNALLTYFIISTTLKALVIAPTLALMQTFFELLLALVFVGILLLCARKLKLFLQTMTVIFACEALITVCAIPMTFWLRMAERDTILIPFYLHLFFVAWGFAVIAYILRSVLVKEASFGYKLAGVYLLQTFGISTILLYL